MLSLRCLATQIMHSILKNIHIRPVTKTDAELLFRLMTSPKWIQYIGDRGIVTVNDAENYIENKMHPILAKKGFVNHIIIDAETQQEVGTCSLHQRSGMPGLDIGYAILEEFEGNGDASAGTVKMIQLASEAYQVQEVYAITTEQNSASIKVLQKIGFESDKTIRLENSQEDLMLFRLKISELSF